MVGVGASRGAWNHLLTLCLFTLLIPSFLLPPPSSSLASFASLSLRMDMNMAMHDRYRHRD